MTGDADNFLHNIGDAAVTIFNLCACEMKCVARVLYASASWLDRMLRTIANNISIKFNRISLVDPKKAMGRC